MMALISMLALITDDNDGIDVDVIIDSIDIAITMLTMILML